MSNDTIISEVTEELRRDRMRKLWRQAAPWVIGGAVAVVIAVAGYETWTWWQKSQSARSSDQFYAATTIADGTDFAAAKKALDDVIAQGAGGYPMLAQFREAALLSSQGKTDDAVAAYDSLSQSLNDTHLRELALILAGNLLIDKGEVAAVQQRVGGSLTPTSPLRNAAREIMGLVQYKAGKLDDAMKSFTDVMNDPRASRDTVSRVQLFALQLQAEGAKPIAPPADTTTPPASSAPSAPSAEASSAAPVASSAPASSSAAVSSAASSASASAPSAAVSSAAVSSAASAAVDSSVELDVTPPAAPIDLNMLSMAAPTVSSEASASSVPAVSSASAPSSEPSVSSSASVSSSSAP